MKRSILSLLIFGIVCYFITMLFAQADVSGDYGQKRDPFIPLIDQEGRIRRNFSKPISAGEIAPRINLQGISKVNNVFYAIIDGKWVKEGDMVGDLTIDKVELDKIILRFGEKKFEVKLYMERK